MENSETLTRPISDVVDNLDSSLFDKYDMSSILIGLLLCGSEGLADD